MSEPVLPARYELGPPVGHGAMGSVWRARDRVLDVAVAVKIPHLAFADTTRGRAFFDREVRAAASIVHPHLVPLHDWGHLDGGTPFLAMAWADGGSLETPPTTWTDLRDRVAEVLSALAALHARGLVHRDLKPANVLVHRGRSWVADLGLAAATEDLGRGPSRVEGTPKYMAPEQREGRVREIGPATDLYAVGAILDELSAGMLVPEDLEDLLHALLHPDPLGRYDLAADASRALFDLGEPVIERAPGARIAPVASSAARSSHRTFAFDDPDADDPVTAEVAAGPPPWNRPAPPPWPELPPPEPRDTTRLRASLPLFALREPPLVGRDALRERAWRAVGGVLRAGKPAVIVLCGEPGSGKTRIADSVARALEEGGHAEVVRVRDLPGGGPDHGFEGAALRLLRCWDEPRAALEARLGRWLTRDRGPEADALVPALCAWVGLREGDEPEADRGLGAQLVLDHLRARAWRGVSALLVDDAHHDAEVTFDALSGLLIGAHLGDRLPLVAFVTCDPQRLDAGGRAALGRLVAAGAERVDVPRLDREATRELVDVLLPLGADVAEWLAQRCEGHPLLARQILVHWAERGVLVDAGQLVFTAAPDTSLESELPTDAAAAYLARLDALGHTGDDTERALAALAAAGDTMPEPVFRAVSGGLAPSLLTSGLMQRAEGWCRWEHGLIATALRARLDARPDREALYDEVAAAWERFGNVSGRPADEQVGLLRLAAGRPAEALAPLLRACAAACEGVRLLEHDRCAAAALVAVEQAGSAVPDLDRARARYHAAMALLRVGRAKDAVPLLISARAGFAGDARGAAEALMVLAAAHDLLGERDLQAACIDELEDLARQARTSEIGCIALRARGRDRLNHGHLEEAEELLARLVVEEKAAGRELDALSALTDLAKARARRGRLEQAAESAHQALAIARRRGSLVHEGPALHMLGTVATYGEDFEAAEPLLRRALHVAVLAHDETRVQLIVGDLAGLAHSRGDLERARAGYLANLAYSVAKGLRRWEAVDRIRVGILAMQSADGPGVLAQADALDPLVGALQEPRLVPTAYALHLVGHALTGDRARLNDTLAAWDPEMGRLDLPLVRGLERAAEGLAQRGWEVEARSLAERVAACWMQHDRPEDAERARAIG